MFKRAGQVDKRFGSLGISLSPFCDLGNCLGRYTKPDSTSQKSKLEELRAGFDATLARIKSTKRKQKGGGQVGQEGAGVVGGVEAVGGEGHEGGVEGVEQEAAAAESDAWYGLGKQLSTLQMFDEAAHAYERAGSLQPARSSAFVNHAIVRFNKLAQQGSAQAAALQGTGTLAATQGASVGGTAESPQEKAKRQAVEVQQIEQLLRKAIGLNKVGRLQ
jgi:hypothetical protein